MEEAKNKKIYAINKPRSKPKPITESDLITSNLVCSNVFYRKFVVDELKKSYPLSPGLWYVDKIYKDTIYGEVYFDEPKNDWELKKSQAKKEALKDKIFIIINTSDNLETLEKKLNDELKRLKKCQ